MYIEIEQHNEDMARLRAEHKKEIVKLKAECNKIKAEAIVNAAWTLFQYEEITHDTVEVFLGYANGLTNSTLLRRRGVTPADFAKVRARLAKLNDAYQIKERD